MDSNGGLNSVRGWDLVALLFAFVMVLAFADEIVRGGKVPFYRDLGPYFYPMRYNLAQSLRAWELPLWNRHVAMGFPLAANIQAGAFYPPHLLFVVQSFFDAIRYLFVLHFLIAAAGAYWLCRLWTFPPHLALVGSILFTFGGVMVSLSNLLDHFQAAVWLPWVVFFGERALRGRHGKDFLLLVFVLLLQLLAGSPEIYLLTLGLLLLRAVELKAGDPAVPWRHVALVVGGASGLSLALGMVQIVPTVELFLHSWRSEGLPLAKGTSWSLTPLGSLNLFFLDKEPNPFAFNGINLFFTRERPLIISLYLGAVVPLSLCLWFLTSSRKERAICSALAAAALGLSLGGHTFVYGLLFRYLPGFSLIRFPEKFLFVVSALLLTMALRGLHRALGGERSLSFRAWIGAGLIPLLALALPYLYLRFHMDGLIQFVADARRASPFEVSTLQISSGVLVHLERQIFVTAGCVALVIVSRIGALRPALFAWLLASVVFFDLGSAHRPYLFPLDPDVVTGKPAILAKDKMEPGRLFYNHQLTYLHPSAYRFSLRPFSDTVASVFAALIPNTGVFRGLDYMQELDSLGRKPYHRFLELANELPADKVYRILGALSVRYIVSLQELPPGDITLIRHLPEYPVWLYRVDRWAPRAYVAPSVSFVPGTRERLMRLASSEIDPRGEVIVDEPIELAPSSGFEARAEVLTYNNRIATIRADLNQRGILVLADSFYPGWTAYVDGTRKRILRANYFFRGVLLEPGVHVVEFKYEPWSFKVGAVVSAAAMVLILGAVGIRCRQRRAANRAP